MSSEEKDKKNVFYDGWEDDDDFDHNEKLLNQKTQKNKLRPQIVHKSSFMSYLKWLLMISVFIIFSVYGLIYILRSGQQKHATPISTELSNISQSEQGTSEEQDISENQDTQAISNEKPQDLLSDIDFDFSPILNRQVLQQPQLPNKVKKPKVQKTASDELEDLWENGTSQNNDSFDEAQNSQDPDDLYPNWRKYAVSYKPTQGKPVFSVILEYDPEILNVNDLPKGNGYNIIIPGFMEYSQTISKILREKNYEILLYLPMGESSEALNFKAVTKNSTFNDIRSAIKFHTSQLNGEGFVGFMDYGKNKQVNKSLSKMNFMMSLLQDSGHLFIDNMTDPENKSFAFAAATGQGVPSLKAENYISSVQKEFAQFINKVRLDGQGVAIVKATPENIVALKAYQKGIDNEGIVRIPVSGILKTSIS